MQKFIEQMKRKGIIYKMKKDMLKELFNIEVSRKNRYVVVMTYNIYLFITSVEKICKTFLVLTYLVFNDCNP